MESIRFKVKVMDEVVAEHMDLVTAIILLEALFNKYFQQASRSGMEVTIVSEPLRGGAEDGTD